MSLCSFKVTNFLSESDLVSCARCTVQGSRTKSGQVQVKFLFSTTDSSVTRISLYYHTPRPRPGSECDIPASSYLLFSWPYWSGSSPRAKAWPAGVLFGFPPYLRLLFGPDSDPQPPAVVVLSQSVQLRGPAATRDRTPHSARRAWLLIGVGSHLANHWQPAAASARLPRRVSARCLSNSWSGRRRPFTRRPTQDAGSLASSRAARSQQPLPQWRQALRLRVTSPRRPGRPG